MDNQHDSAIEAVLEQLIEHGPEGIATVFARAFEMAMRLERERFLGAQLYERTPGRRGYAQRFRLDWKGCQGRCARSPGKARSGFARAIAN